ncbi:DUF2147 domain-containing protein [Methyloceanibacter sp.]|jgi:uncharacterized protein (DUF2147 family)|uniref:DUF2147 domain-containing protein n=1 Tax=Methyloceanibacter sp. TaxID=1965321 RepID=UPI00356238C3
MRHHSLTAAIGIVLAAALLPLSATSAMAADPTGYWRKAEQRSKWPGKMLIHGCGSGKRYLCVKIAWVKNPVHEGKPLRDVLNKNTSLRSREIVGLQIARGLAKVAGNQWKGNIYNPEDGRTYSATLTQVSRSKIILKGCMGFMFCGERVWVRTSPPPKEPEPEAKPEEQIEAKAEPEATPEAASVAAAEPAASPEAATNVITPAAAASNSMGTAEMATPAAHQSTEPGYHFLNSAAAAPESANFTGNDLPSMFHMTTPLDQNAVAATEGAPTPVTQPQPQARTIEANAAPAPAPQPNPAPPQAKPAAAPKPVAAPKPIAAPTPAAAPAPAVSPEPAPADVSGSTETADATDATAPVAAPSRPLTWRERRRLRRQQRLRQQTEGVLPWAGQ